MDNEEGDSPITQAYHKYEIMCQQDAEWNAFKAGWMAGESHAKAHITGQPLECTPPSSPCGTFRWAMAQVAAGKVVSRRGWYGGFTIPISRPGYEPPVDLEDQQATDWVIVS